jgi:hypothetical protein
MWFECTFAFTMLEPWEKILCGESVREMKDFGGFFERFGFRSVGDHDPVPARRYGFRPILPPARQENVR